MIYRSIYDIFWEHLVTYLEILFFSVFYPVFDAFSRPETMRPPTSVPQVPDVGPTVLPPPPVHDLKDGRFVWKNKYETSR